MTSKRRWLTTLVTAGAALGLSGGIAYAATAPAAASTVHTVSAVHSGTAPSATHRASRSTSESAGESSAEHSGESAHSDGPGGHADPAGNVDHQFNGQE